MRALVYARRACGWTREYLRLRFWMCRTCRDWAVAGEALARPAVAPESSRPRQRPACAACGRHSSLVQVEAHLPTWQLAGAGTYDCALAPEEEPAPQPRPRPVLTLLRGGLA